ADVVERDAELLGGDLRDDAVGALSDLGGAAEDGDAAAPRDLDLDPRLGHVVRVDRVVGPGDVARARDAHAAAVRQTAELVLPPAGPLDGVQTLEEAVGLDAQLVDRAGVRAEEVAAPELDRVEADGFGELVELDLEGEARLDGAVAAL